MRPPSNVIGVDADRRLEELAAAFVSKRLPMVPVAAALLTVIPVVFGRLPLVLAVLPMVMVPDARPGTPMTVAPLNPAVLLMVRAPVPRICKPDVPVTEITPFRVPELVPGSTRFTLFMAI